VSSRRFGPLTAEYAAKTPPCAACGEAFMVGDYLGLAPIGPGRDHENQAKAREGRPYNAVALPVH